MENKIIQAGVSSGVDFGDPADWLGVEDAVANNAKLASAFAHQNIAAGKKSHPERTGECFGDDSYLDFVLFSGVENERTITQGRAGKIDHIGLTVENCGKY